MKKFLANIALLGAVTLICLGLAEIGLRAFTPFPIHGKKANKIYDRDFGYRLNPRHPSIDKNGFRNRGEKKPVVAAVGDSHTYGSGVKYEQTWPVIFEKITGVPTYNFGVGSYAVYADYAVARQAISQGYKYVIIALLIHNDFKISGNSCDIDYASSPFWRKAKSGLSLQLPQCELKYNWRTARAPKFVRWFRGRADSAILSAIDYLVVRPLSNEWHRFKTRQPSKKSPAKPAAGEQATASAPAPAGKWPASAYFGPRAIKNQEIEYSFTDLERRAVRNGIEDFEKMLADLKRAAAAKGARVGLMFIPTKVQLMYEYADDKDVYEQVPLLRKMALNHRKIEDRLSAFLTGQGIDWSSAAPELIAAMEESERKGLWLYPPNGGHPYPRGFRAYAEAAKKLYERMSRN